MYIKKRYVVLAVTFALSVTAVLGGFILLYMNGEKEYKTKTAAIERENVTALADSLEQIDIELKRGSYAETPYQAVICASKILVETGNAKAYLQNLPTFELYLSDTAKYLSQTGEFAFLMATKAVRGEEISEEEQSELSSLSTRAGELSEIMRNFSGEIISENCCFDDMSLYFTPSEDVSAVSTDGKPEKTNIFEKMEMLFEKDNPLYYDGAFSDIKTPEKDKFWNGKKAVSDDEAKKLAAFYMDVDEKNLKADTDIFINNTACCRFTTENQSKSAVITKDGGFLLSYFADTEISDIRISEEEAEKIAEKFLEKCGFEDMVKTENKIVSNILTVTFVSEKDGVMIYPENVKISVGLDDGKIISLLAENYFSNLKKERVFTEKISESEALSQLSSRLSPIDVKKAFMKTSGGREYPCFEFVCNSEKDGKVRVFINSENGNEELILLENE